MSYHGKLQTLKNGTADAEIQLWAYLQLEKEPAELTDEEIMDIWNSLFKDFSIDIGMFARAILLKAQEK